MAEQTPLYAEHIKLQGKIVEFAGFLLPVQFPEGIAAEHRAVREGAGLFDVSHMGEIEIRGRDAYLFLDYLLPRDLSKVDQAIVQRRALYSVMCAADGTAVDDLLIYPLASDQCLLVVNAANIAADEAHIRMVLAEWSSLRTPRPDAVIENQSARWAQLALQGPKSLDVLARLATRLLADPLAAQQWLAGLSALKRYAFTRLSLAINETTDGLPVEDLLISRTGYTGEDGFEFYVRPQAAPRLWNLLLAAGAVPIGLGARDTLRLEAAMPLYGHELSRSITPREAGLDRFMALGKPDFIGRAALQAEPARTLIGLVSEGKAIPRADYPVLAGDRVVGYVTSGTFSPTLGKGIALALIDRSVPDTQSLAVEIRGRAEPFARCPLPFV